MVTANVAVCAPAVTVTPAGTVATPGLLLESATTAPPCGAPPDNVTVPCAGEPPTRLEGEIMTLCSVAAGGCVTAGVTVRLAVRVVPLYVAVMVTVVVDETVEVAIAKVAVKLIDAAVVVAGTLAIAGWLLDSAITAPPSGAGVH